MPIVDRYDPNTESGLGYKLFIPKNYESLPNEVFPFILFLHGMKKRGNDLSLLNGYGLPAFAERTEDFPFLVMAPQCPSDTLWPDNRNAVMNIVRRAIAEYRVDRSRIYVVGFSMGGNGVWDFAAHTEGMFAAAVPMAGWFETDAAGRLLSVPIWAFHGEDDDTVPISRTETMVQAIARAGGAPKFTRYPGLKHSIMEETFSNPELFEWLLKHYR